MSKHEWQSAINLIAWNHKEIQAYEFNDKTRVYVYREDVRAAKLIKSLKEKLEDEGIVDSQEDSSETILHEIEKTLNAAKFLVALEQRANRAQGNPFLLYPDPAEQRRRRKETPREGGRLQQKENWNWRELTREDAPTNYWQDLYIEVSGMTSVELPGLSDYSTIKARMSRTWDQDDPVFMTEDGYIIPWNNVTAWAPAKRQY
jgi:hypothetical protein